MAAWSKVCTVARLLGIAGSNSPPWYGCLSLVSVVRYRFLRLADHSSRGVPLSVVCLRRGLNFATLKATRQQVKSSASKSAGSKLVMPIARTNEKAGQSASIAVVHHSTSQRRTQGF